VRRVPAFFAFRWDPPPHQPDRFMAYAPPIPAAGAGPPAPAPPPPPPAPEAESAQNALLPRGLFGDDVKPGDTITLKVSAIYGDEVEVAATATPAEPTEETEEPEAPPGPTADEEIEAASESVNYG
jgi:hypothetical protein